MMEYRCVIVDDEPLAIQVLQHHIGKMPELKCIKTMSDATGLREYLDDHPVDILFLDIEMPGIKGIDFLKTLTDPPLTILTTAYSQYGADGFAVGAFDYLVKPVEYDRFLASIKKAIKQITLEKHYEASFEKEKKMLVIRSGLKKISIAHSDIVFIKGLKDYSVIHTVSEKYIVKGNIRQMLDLLPPSFVRVHKSYIVATDKIKQVSYDQVDLGKVTIPLGRVYRESAGLKKFK